MNRLRAACLRNAFFTIFLLSFFFASQVNRIHNLDHFVFILILFVLSLRCSVANANLNLYQDDKRAPFLLLFVCFCLALCTWLSQKSRNSCVVFLFHLFILLLLPQFSFLLSFNLQLARLVFVCFYRVCSACNE